MFKLVRHVDYISIFIHSRSEEIELKFDEESIAAEEGYKIVDRDTGISADIPICIGFQCHRGCGCKCLRDYGYLGECTSYISPDDDINLCRTKHQIKGSVEEDSVRFSLVKIKEMLTNLHTAFIIGQMSAEQ